MPYNSDARGRTECRSVSADVCALNTSVDGQEIHTICCLEGLVAPLVQSASPWPNSVSSSCDHQHPVCTGAPCMHGIVSFTRGRSTTDVAMALCTDWDGAAMFSGVHRSVLCAYLRW